MSKQNGSLNWYMQYSGGFVNNLIKAIQTADEFNRERLRRAFPQLVAAYEMQSWDEAPPNYPPEYNAIEGDPDRERWITAAINQYGKEGEIEIDPNAVVSRNVGNPASDGPGAYVAAWVWIEGEEEEEE